MTTPFLIADAAEVAVMSPLAEAAFGSYDLQVPEGIDIEDIHDFEAPGNELGYVARLSPQRATGIARRFIRADVAVTAKDDTDPDVIPESDVDRVLSEAESRVESEFFLESDITKAGLGAWVPYVDFNVGDIVNVRIFDIWVKLPVTRIEPIISEGDIVDWRVHVGGQLLSDDQAREVENATIQKELIQDRRDLAGIDAKATKAVKDSSEAKSTADNALQATEDNRTYIDEQLEAAGVAVEQGREYLLQMQQHVTAGVAHSGLAQSMASEANSYAQRAIAILDQLDPLRDDVVAAHAEVTRLHEEASQFTSQAAEHVRQASQHAADAVASASSASQHAADGKRYAADARAEAEIAEGFADSASSHAADGKQHAANALAEADRAQQFVGQASSHAETAQGYVTQAKSHADEGARQAGLAASSASDALQNANRAQGIVDDANGLLSQVQGYSQEAKDALAGAEALLDNVDGSGKSLGDVLLEVAQKHQETLTAHGDILDLHSEVLEKHGEAINYVAIAAAQATTAAQHAAKAAQEALDVANNAALAAGAAADAAESAGEVAESALQVGQDAAKAASSASTAASEASKAAQSATKVGQDAALAAGHAADAADEAGKAASSAGQAADEAAQAAENNRQAIGKLQEADGKLQEADQKLQQQIDILEESQELLANAVKILAGAVTQAAMAAQSALNAADNAGKAAGEALTASQHNSSAIDAMEDAIEARDAAGEAWQATQDAINDEQNELIGQLKSQQEELARIQSESVNTIMATSAGTNFPGVNTRTSSGGYDWEFTIPDTRGALAKIEYWSGAGATKTLSEVQVGAVSSSGLVIKTYNDRFIQVTWAKPRAIQRSISGLSTTAVTPPQTSWTTVSGISITAGNRASQGYVTVKARWSAANRGSTYGIRLMVNGVAQSSKVTSKLGPLTFLQDGESTFTASFTNVSVPAGQSLQVQVYSTASSDSARRVNRVELSGSWIETA